MALKAEKIQEKRDVILEAAIDVFTQKGYHAAKIQDIAEKLSMGHGTLYCYFKNKLDIFSTVIDEIVLKIQSVIADEDPNSTNNLSEYQEQIYRFGNKIYDLFIEDTRIIQILYFQAPGIDPALNQKIEGMMSMNNSYAQAYLQNGINKGFLRKDIDTHVTAKAIIAMIFEGAKDILTASDKNDTANRWIQAVSTLMLEGLASSSKP